MTRKNYILGRLDSSKRSEDLSLREVESIQPELWPARDALVYEKKKKKKKGRHVAGEIRRGIYISEASFATCNVYFAIFPRLGMPRSRLLILANVNVTLHIAQADARKFARVQLRADAMICHHCVTAAQRLAFNTESSSRERALRWVVPLCARARVDQIGF